MFPWLKRKSRNRRFERETVLDVKLRTNQTRAARFRVAGIALSFFFALAVIVFVFWRGGQWLLDYFIYKNNAFAITQIDAQTDGVVAGDVIRQWAKVQRGDNLLALDLMRVKHILEDQPVIQSVAVERILPHTLKLRVSEREPIAQTIVSVPRARGGFDQVILHLDENGFVMRPLDPRLRATPLTTTNEQLPIIVGVNANDLQLGKPVENPQIRAALKLISEFDHSQMAGFVDVQKISITTPEILQAFTSQGAEITFSLSGFDTQLRRWRTIYDQYQQWGKAIASLDLSISNNLPVRWVAANALPQVAPKIPKTSRTKKKHV